MVDSLHASRRAELLERVASCVAVLPSAPVAIRNNDVEHEYRQDSDLQYLTGFTEPESVLVLSNVHPEHRAVMFLRPVDPEREVWDGPRLGVDAAAAALGVDAAFPIAELAQRLPDYLGNARRVLYAAGRDRAFDERLFAALAHTRRLERKGISCPTEIHDPAAVLHEMRLRKSPEELVTMRRAAEITREAHLRAMRVARPGRYEHEVEAVLLETFRAAGSERPAYGPIVGSGPNATVLHHRRNDRRLEEGELLLVDAGCELGYYACDVTRTFPVSGRFSPEQRALYDVVLAAQKAAIARVAPGATVDEVHMVAVEVITEGLVRLGLVEGPTETAIAEGRYRRLFMHRTSHWLGMDVHDVGSYLRDGAARPLEPGFVLTVEPGIYVSPKDEQVEARWRGIGIRIEDDVVVVPEGHQLLTHDIPKEVGELEW